MLEHVIREDELSMGAHCVCHLIPLAFAMLPEHKSVSTK